MNRLLSSLAALGLAASLAACGDRAPADAEKTDGGMTSSPSMPMKGDMPMMKEGMKDGMAAAGSTATGSGLVTAIDKAAGTITIQHGPIPALEWPAMTMAFKADPATLLDTVKVGDKVEFDIATEDSRVTAIRRR